MGLLAHVSAQVAEYLAQNIGFWSKKKGKVEAKKSY